jgi:hypothetical protein
MQKYFLQNAGEVVLTDSDFIAQGGQASIYVKNSTAYKIYSDPKRMIPAAKINELSVLNHPLIVRPQNILFDSEHCAVGYTMRHVKNAFALCQMFPKSFRQRRNLTPDAVFRLVQNLQETVRYVHSKNVLIVDLNEFNFLVADDLRDVYFLDVDSYQTNSFPATALMESVRDRHAGEFNQGTDWFAFAILSFQMFVGIHPFKGTYPPFQNKVGKSEMLDARMRANISVFHQDVSVPSACLGFDVIPSAYLDWYRAVFEMGERVPPPRAAQETFQIKPQRIERLQGGDQFEITEIYEFDDDVLRHFENITVTSKSVYVGNRKLGEHPGDAVIALTQRLRHVITARIEAGKVCLRDLTTGRELKADIYADEIMSASGLLYIKRDSLLLEAIFLELPNAILFQAKTIGNLLKNATQLFEGTAIQNLMGAYYASLLPEAGVCHQLRIKELDDYKIVDAKFSETVLVVVGARAGVYNRFVFRFDDEFQNYDLRVTDDIQTPVINLAILDNGVCLLLNDRDELEIFSRRKNSEGLKIIADSMLRGDFKLLHHGAQALFADRNKIYKFTMRRS